MEHNRAKTLSQSTKDKLVKLVMQLYNVNVDNILAQQGDCQLYGDSMDL